MQRRSLYFRLLLRSPYSRLLFEIWALDWCTDKSDMIAECQKTWFAHSVISFFKSFSPSRSLSKVLGVIIRSVLSIWKSNGFKTRSTFSSCQYCSFEMICKQRSARWCMIEYLWNIVFVSLTSHDYATLCFFCTSPIYGLMAFAIDRDHFHIRSSEISGVLCWAFNSWSQRFNLSCFRKTKHWRMRFFFQISQIYAYVSKYERPTVLRLNNHKISL